MTQGEKSRDLVLAPGEYAYLQDETKGHIKVHIGPMVTTPATQDRPVVYNQSTKSFRRCNLEEAVTKCPIASEGEYVILENPASDNKFPPEGSVSQVSPSLKMGRKVNLSGPTTFGLWPGQTAVVVPGHHLRSNQYLLVRVYNELEARHNWEKQTVAVVANPTDADTADKTAAPISAAPESLNLTIGKLIIIKGTQISFYIPPTGVEVVPDENKSFVREAVTLEQLEYCILIDENGNRRYERGPQVVFPSPTEQFHINNGNRVFRAIELNACQGIHVKVVAPYEQATKKFDVGTELFITGEQSAIYFPRKEHSIIHYGDKQKHYATAVPAGEGRYVIDRNTGEIITEKGPKMLLPDPRDKVIVRRILSDKQCELWYPGNKEALDYNRSLREIAKETPSSRSGFVSEGDLTRKMSSPAMAPGGSMRHAFPASYSNFAGSPSALMESVSLHDAPSAPAVAESFERGTQYTAPRTLTLDTKYDGVPCITVWTGYAVLVVSKTGKRRVIIGPQTVLLDYDEVLEVLELSTGKPKTTDKLEKTVYLRVSNNKVTDIIDISTKDKVEVTLKLSYRINFEGEDSSRWFQVENYVKYLCDHVRSVLKGMAQKKKIEDLDNNAVDLIRDTLLGESVEGKRPGMFFEDNGMRIMEVEILSINIKDPEIAKLLNNAQHGVVAGNINLHQAERELEISKRKEEIQRDKLNSEFLTVQEKSRIDAERLKLTTTLELARLNSEKERAIQEKDTTACKEDVTDLSNNRELVREKASADRELQQKKDEAAIQIDLDNALTRNVCSRFDSAQGGFTTAVMALHDQETLVKVSQALSVQTFIGGNNVVEAVQGLLKGSGLEGIVKNISDRMTGSPATNGPTIPAVRK